MLQVDRELTFLMGEEEQKKEPLKLWYNRQAFIHGLLLLGQRMVDEKKRLLVR